MALITKVTWPALAVRTRVDKRVSRRGGCESFWDVAVAVVSEMEGVREARAHYEEGRKRERHFLLRRSEDGTVAEFYRQRVAALERQ